MSKQETNLAALLPSKQSDLVFEERPIPSPGPDQVLIRNRAVALNLIDWKRQAWGMHISSYPVILGADVSGVITKVGSAVTDFKPGDRVSSSVHGVLSHDNDEGAYQTYSLGHAGTTTRLPDAITFEQGATLPTATITSTMALFDELGLPHPGPHSALHTDHPSFRSAILVWGGASSVGSMAIQLAHIAGYTVLATARQRHHEYLRSLGADVLVDYTSPTAVQDLITAVERSGKQLCYAVDCISNAETLAPAAEVLAKTPGADKKLAHLTPWVESVARPDGIRENQVLGEQIWTRRQDLVKWLHGRALPKWLEDGTVKPFNYRVVEGGIRGLQDGLNELKKGSGGEKILVQV